MLELSIAAGEEKVQYWLILLLDHLLERNEITNEQYKQMYPNLKTLELARIYFNLKFHKPEISVRPIIASINAPARQISSFLDQLLTPIYNYVSKDITFINSIDLIRKLKDYTEKGYLTSTTLFVTFDMADLYTMIPREDTIAALRRYIDDVFMTTNLTTEEILQELNETMKTDPNIKITITINQALEYLDASIENNNGQLKTTIYHKSAWKPHILPYESDHP
ncbi:unnamed protein product [Rotaria sordida]|nr:unnamed protein product [Rotaria sordida]